MTLREQLRRVCQWNRQLARERAVLRIELERARQEAEQLEAVNAQLRVERDTADLLLAEAMDAAVEAT